MLTFAWLALAGGARADIYSFTDASGVEHFSNVPADRRYALFLHTPADGGTAVPARAAGELSAVEARRRIYAPYIEAAAQAQAVDASLLHAVIATESGYNPHAVSRKGAMGLMQLMPETARRYGAADPYDPAQNVSAGARYLRDLLARFDNDLSLTLAAYNAGEEAVAKYGNAIPPFSETVRYVPKVLKLYGGRFVLCGAGHWSDVRGRAGP